MAAKKVLIHAAKSCGGTLEVLYTAENLPYLRCDRCEHRVNDWIKWHSDYRNYWSDPVKWSSKKDAVTCLLSYFAELYRRFYEVDFTFSFNENGLFRGPEMNHVRRMFKMLDENVDAARSYLDWVFKTQVEKKKRQITSLGFIAVPDIITQFKLSVKKSKAITRHTPLPEAIRTWTGVHVPELGLRDFGDLKMVLEHHSKGLIEPTDGFNLLLTKLKDSNYVTEDWQVRNWSK